MKAFFAGVSFSLIGIVFPVVCSASPLNRAPDKKVSERLVDVFQKKLNTRVNQILISDVPNLYEVYTDDRIFYITENGKYVIYGDIIDTETRANISASRILSQGQDRVDTRHLPVEDALKISRGNGEKVIYSFCFSAEDCNKIHSTFNSIADSTTYLFVSVPDNADIKKMKSVCEIEKSLSLFNRMSNAFFGCDTDKYSRNAKLASSLRIESSMLINFSGVRLPIHHLSSEKWKKYVYLR